MSVRLFDRRYGVATIVWCGIILWTSLAAEVPGQRLFEIPFGDKIAHVCGYALLCWLATMSLRRAMRPYTAAVLIVGPLVFSVAFGVLNEIAQMLVSYRECEPGDVVADALGALSVQAGLIRRQLNRNRNEVPQDGAC